MAAAMAKLRRAGVLALPVLTFLAILGVLFGEPVGVLATPYQQIFTAGGIGAAVAACLVAATSIRRLSDEAADAHELAAGLLENLPLAAYVDEAGAPMRSIYASPQMETLLGYGRDEWYADPDLFERTLHPDDRERVLAVHADAAEHRRPLDLEYRVIAKDGRTIWVQDQAVVVEEDGRTRWKGYVTDVTTRKESETELRKAQELYQGVVENSADAILLVALDGTILFASRGCTRSLGYDVHELVGTTAATYLHPDDAERARHASGRALAGVSEPFVVRFRDKAGAWRLLEGVPTAIPDEHGRPEAILAVTRDVTERVRVHEAMQRLAEQNRLLLEAAGEGILASDRDGRITLINPAAARQLGCDANDVIGRNAHDLFHHSRADGTPYPREECPIALTVGGDEVACREDEVFWRADGTSFPVEYTTTRVEEDGAFVGVVTVFRDISKRKATEQALRESERRYRELFENAHDLIVTTDLDERITSVNQSFERVLGYSRDEAVGMKLTDIQPPTADAAAEQTRRKLAGETETTTFQLDHIAKDGRHVPLEVSSRLIHHDGVPVGTQGVARDLTERRRLEEQLNHARKMEAVGQLAGGVAHDFNNSLMAIRGYTELMLGRLDPDDPLRRHAEGIEKAADGATSVTRQLLAFSRKQMLQPRVLDLGEIVGELEQMLRRLIGAHITLDVQAAADLGRVRVDRGQLEQVLMNLAVNARDAMPDGGRLTIETTNVEVDELAMQTTLDLKPGPYVRLTVSDTGTGMPPDVRERVFEPFFSTKQQGVGTGLGLATVYGIVKQSGGAISVYSEIGRGTCFKVYLPSLEIAATVEARVESDAPGGTETVLLVEDEDAVRELVGEILEGLGYDVVSAANGTEALLLVKERAPDVLLTDVVMPDMPGPQLAMRVNLHRPDAKVIYMSGYTNDTVLNLGGRSTSIAFLQKPFTRPQLAGALRGVLDGTGARNEAVSA